MQAIALGIHDGRAQFGFSAAVAIADNKHHACRKRERGACTCDEKEANIFLALADVRRGYHFRKDTRSERAFDDDVVGSILPFRALGASANQVEAAGIDER